MDSRWLAANIAYLKDIDYFQARRTCQAPKQRPSTEGDKDQRATRDNFARDMQWGQGIQLLEDLDAEALDAVRNPGGISTRPPTPLVVKAGEQLRAAVRLSSDSVVLQFGVRRAAGA